MTISVNWNNFNAMWNDPKFGKFRGRVTRDEADTKEGFWKEVALLMFESKTELEGKLIDVLYKTGQQHTKNTEVIKALASLIVEGGR
jgi:hypothetical protein